ncbi:glycosyltransferase family 4 protein [Chromohalobacter israelensis]|uniref:Glycosyl transferase, group 1 n=1 Tax=Chromohalobacter israelensis (strain ATCC BAA-138 / DSM 3043 / CIP 106854 / NCIMB 13768 / 1H11) TaxID=290398 RepID=Q1QWT5_CHRI1|nr:glycosyltransferase family 4 protein [Chromohalobacter salexigens]ABE59073.1 glycosyl transferase, group 1 [Chromohalobacter salexigens DSM 3043]
MNDKTIVLVSNTSWFLYNFCQGLLRALERRGFRVVCLVPHDDYSQRLCEEFNVTLRTMPMDGKSTGPAREGKCLFWLFGQLRELRPAFVFNFTIKANIYSGLACRALNLPYANTVTGLGTAFLHDSRLFRQVRRLYGVANAGATRVFFLNPDDRELFEHEGMLQKVDWDMLPGAGVDVARFGFKPLPTGEPFTFLLIARLLGDKGVREYVAAAEQVRATHPETRFLIVGPKGVSNRTAIEDDEVDAWHAGGVVEYVGAQDDVRPWLAQAHVLVLPSYREGMPSTVMEAAAMGRPAIVTDVPGCRHAVTEGETGWLCRVKDAEALATRMRYCLAMTPWALSRVGVAARRRAEKEFSQDIVVTGYLACLESGLTSHQRVKMEA